MSAEGKGLKGLFEKIDKDGSGKIDKEELKKALGEDNISEEMIRRLFEKYDINKDKLLDKKELIAFLKENKLCENFLKEHLKGVKALFERMDADGSKQIDCRELRRALGEDKVSDEVIELLFKKYDKNKDGFLDEKEIKKFFKENSLYLDLCNENLMPVCNKPAQPKRGVKGLFERMDKDGSNKIDCQELRAALGEDNVSGQIVRKLFEEYDTNKDGYLDLKEIKKFFKENKIYSDLCTENLK